MFLYVDALGSLSFLSVEHLVKSFHSFARFLVYFDYTQMHTMMFQVSSVLLLDYDAVGCHT
jgi:hypothetical protein